MLSVFQQKWQMLKGHSLMSVFNALQHFLVVSICFAFCSGSIHCTVHYTVAWVLLICNLLLQF